MPDYPIDPELRIRGSPRVILRRTTEAMVFIRKMTLGRSGYAWLEVQHPSEALRRHGARHFVVNRRAGGFGA